jgi:hypothetical protein
LSQSASTDAEPVATTAAAGAPKWASSRNFAFRKLADVRARAGYYSPVVWLRGSEFGEARYGRNDSHERGACRHAQPVGPAGVANAHQVVNRSGAPCSYLILGSRAIPDVVHYPDREDVLYTFEDGSWRLERTNGTLIKEGTPDRGGKREAFFLEFRKAEVQLRRRPTSGSSATEGPPPPRPPYALLSLSHSGRGRPDLQRIFFSRF